MNTLPVHDPYEALRPVMNRYGATGSAQDFYWAVNQAYHTVKAQRYDVLHQTMFVGLEPVWRALLGHAASHPKQKLRVLDVRAGTGLVGGFVEMHLADRVAAMTMLDPCAAMLEKCRSRADLFSFPCAFRQGDVEELAEEERFDVITINSVLHHIVDLPAFFARVRTLLAPQGWFLAAHAPRAEASADSELQARRRAWHQARRNFCRSAWTRLGQLVRQAVGCPYVSPQALETSNRLLEQRAVRRPMTMASINSVTEFHVPYHPDSHSEGLSLQQMQDWLEGLTVVADYSSQNHGVPWPALARAEQEQDQRWWLARDKHGQLLASAWRRDCHSKPEAIL